MLSKAHGLLSFGVVVVRKRIPSYATQNTHAVNIVSVLASCNHREIADNANCVGSSCIWIWCDRLIVVGHTDNNEQLQLGKTR